MTNRETFFGQHTQTHDVAVSLYSNRSVAQGARWGRRPMVSHGWSRESASRRSLYGQTSMQRPSRVSVDTSAEMYGCLRQTAAGARAWGVWCDASDEGGQPAQPNTLPWSFKAAGGTIELWELATTLWPVGVSMGGEDTGRAVYYRRRMTIRSLSHLADPWDQPQPVRITAEGIAQLQKILKDHFGLDYTPEQAQEAGQAILRVAGLKLLQELERERTQEQERRA